MLPILKTFVHGGSTASYYPPRTTTSDLQKIGPSSDPDIHFCVHFLAAAAGTLVAIGNPVEGFVLALDLVKPLHHKKGSHGSSVPGDNVLAG